jgi:hypothetical protein
VSGTPSTLGIVISLALCGMGVALLLVAAAEGRRIRRRAKESGVGTHA